MTRAYWGDMNVWHSLVESPVVLANTETRLNVTFFPTASAERWINGSKSPTSALTICGSA